MLGAEPEIEGVRVDAIGLGISGAGLYSITSCCCVTFGSIPADPLIEEWFCNLPWQDLLVLADDAELIDLAKNPNTDGFDE